MKNKNKKISDEKLVFFAGPPGGGSASTGPGTGPTSAPPTTPPSTPDEDHEASRGDALRDIKKQLEQVKKTIPHHEDAMEKHKILAYKWRFDSPEAVDQMFKDWKKLRLPVTNDFYKEKKSHLLRPFTDSSITSLPAGTPGSQDYYTNYTKQEHRDWIAANDKDYMDAIDFANNIRTLIIAQLESKEAIEKRKEEMKSDPAFKQITDHLATAGSDFKEAWQSRDYSTLALYGVGVWALFHTLQKAKAAGGGKYFDWLVYGTAAYCGYQILDRSGTNLGKITGFIDKDADVKGTVFESMGLDENAGLMLAMSEIKVSSLYSLYKGAGHRAFIHPDQFPGVFGELASHRPLDLAKPKNKAEERYVETGKKLFMMMHSVVEMYKQIPDQSQTFEQRYVNNHTTFAALGFDYSQHFSRAVEKKWYQTSDAFDAAQKDLEILDGKISYNLEGATTQGDAQGILMGFPVVFIYNRSKKSYDVKLLKNYPVGEALGNIPLTDKRQTEVALEQIEKAIHAEMDLNLAPLKAFKGVQDLDVQFDGSKWIAKFKTSPTSFLGGFPGEEVTARLHPLASGHGVEIEYGDKVMPLNWVIDNQHPYKAPVVNELVHQNEEYQSALAPFLSLGQLQMKDIDETSNSFKLVVGNMGSYPLDVSVAVTMDPADPTKVLKRTYVIKPESIEKLVNRRKFIDKYTKAIEDRKTSKDIFAKFKQALKSAPESFVLHFLKSVPGWFTEMTRANLLRGMSLSNLTGSITDNKAEAILDSKRELMRAKFRGQADGCKDFAELHMAYTATYGNDLMRIAVLANKFTTKNIEKMRKGEDWDEVEFNKQIIEPLGEVGSDSQTYAGELSKMQTDLWTLISGNDDLRDRQHIIAGEMLGIFAYHTAALDDEAGLDGLQLGLIGQTIDPADTAKLAEQNRAKEGVRKLAYMNYVRRTLIETATYKSEQLKHSVPPASDTNFWGIKDFAHYEHEYEHGLLPEVDTVGLEPPYKHGKDHYTDFEDHYTDAASLTTAPPRGKPVIFRGDSWPTTPAGITTQADKKIFIDKFNESIEMKTKLEERFENRMHRHMGVILDECDKRDVKIYRVNPFMRRFMSPRVVFGPDTPGSRYTVPYPPKTPSEQRLYMDYKKTYKSRGKFKPALLWSYIRELEQGFSYKGTISKSVQDSMIDKEVKRILEKEFFSESGQKIYFRNNSLWDDIRISWRKMWSRL